MTKETQEKIGYIRGLCQKYGTHYLFKYFGFQLKDFAKEMGISKNLITYIIQGKRNLTAKHENAFLTTFEKFKIYEKSKNFVETPGQKFEKELRRRVGK